MPSATPSIRNLPLKKKIPIELNYWFPATESFDMLTNKWHEFKSGRLSKKD